MLDSADLLNLIRLTELEIQKLQSDIDYGPDEKANEAGQMILQMDTLASKLKDQYESIGSDDNDYPTYDDYIELIRNKTTK